MKLNTQSSKSRTHGIRYALYTAVFSASLWIAPPTAFADPPCDQLTDGLSNHPVPAQCMDLHEQLQTMRRVVSPFHSFEVAQVAGWGAQISECVESPMGGMGYHFANIDRLLDGGALSLLHPEVLLYAPTEDGSMEFVGVEYIIPAADWPNAAPPEFFGQTLHYNPVQDIWALHVWLGRHNPEGLFADWNPEVSCTFATH